MNYADKYLTDTANTLAAQIDTAVLGGIAGGLSAGKVTVSSQNYGRQERSIHITITEAANGSVITLTTPMHLNRVWVVGPNESLPDVLLAALAEAKMG